MATSILPCLHPEAGYPVDDVDTLAPDVTPARHTDPVVTHRRSGTSRTYPLSSIHIEHSMSIWHVKRVLELARDFEGHFGKGDEGATRLLEEFVERLQPVYEALKQVLTPYMRTAIACEQEEFERRFKKCTTGSIRGKRRAPIADIP